MLEIGYKDTDIAVIGMSCKFPDSYNYNEFWENMINGKNSVGKLDLVQWNAGSPNQCSQNDNGWTDNNIVKYCSRLKDIDKFDNDFFSISPREAKWMDPQQRILLEQTWHCIEDSGIPINKLQDGVTSVFVGSTGNDYDLLSLTQGNEIDSYAGLGSFMCVLSNRISHCLGFKGESITLDTACSSSLVAIHQAKQSLLMNNSDYAIAAGICLAYHPWRYISFSKAHMMSQDGKCKAFDASADGFVQGEGAGVLLLQPLKKAIEDNNIIYGVIKGTAVNHCGSSNTIVAPSVSAQKNVVEKAIKDAGVNIEDISYIETHGTGTSLGDPIEVEALNQVFSNSTGKASCVLGSVKTNIGHLASASGVAGVIRVLLMMRNNKIPKMLHLQQQNPLIDWNATPFKLATENIDWLHNETNAYRSAGVSGFGFGGVNAHVVIQEYCASRNSNKSFNKPVVMGFSTPTEQSMSKTVANWKSAAFADSYYSLCATWMNSRRQFSKYRAMEVITSTEDIQNMLCGFQMPNANVELKDQGIDIFLGNDDVFASQKFRRMLNYSSVKSVWEQVYRDAFPNAKSVATWSRIKKTHREILVIVSFVRLLSSLGIIINRIGCTGNNLTGVLAACGIITLNEAIQIVNSSIKLDDIRLQHPEFCFWDKINGTKYSNSVFTRDYITKNILDIDLSNERERIDYYLEKAELIRVNQFTLEKLLSEWDKCLSEFDLSIEKLVSEYRSCRTDSEDYNRLCLLIVVITYGSIKKLNQKWDIQTKVDFQNPVVDLLCQYIIDDKFSVKDVALLLLMPHSVDINMLSNQCSNNYIRKSNHTSSEITGNDRIEFLNCIANIKQNGQTHKSYIGLSSGAHIETEEVEYPFLHLLRTLWINGIDLDFSIIFPDEYNKVSLPLYEYNRKSFWVEQPAAVSKPATHPLIDEVTTVGNGHYVLRKTLSIDEFIVKDHIVDGIPILPGVAYLEMAYTAGKAIYKDRDIEIADTTWIQKMEIEDTRDVFVDVVEKDDYLAFKIYTEQKDLITHCTGKIRELKCAPNCNEYQIDTVSNQCTFQIDKDSCYNNIFRDFIGFDYGEGFRVTQYAMGGDNVALEKLLLPETLDGDFNTYSIHPSICDAALRTITWIGGRDAYKQLRLHIPFAVGSVRLFAPFEKECYAIAKLSSDSKKKSVDIREYDIYLVGQKGNIIMEVHNFIIRGMKETTKQNVFLYTNKWREATPVLPSGILSDKTIVHFSLSENRDIRDQFLREFSEYSDENGGYIAVAGSEHFEKIEKTEKTEYLINETNSDNYRALASELSESIDTPLMVILEPSTSLYSSYYQMKYFFIDFLSRFKKQQIDVLVLLNGCGDIPESIGSMYVGFANAISTIIPRTNIRVFYCDKDSIRPAQIIAELLDINNSKREIRYRDCIREYRSFVNIQSAVQSQAVIKKDQWYLITGGCGKIGMSIAKKIVFAHGAKVVLVGRRSELSEETMNDLNSLNRAGNNALYVTCDIGSEDSVTLLANTLKKDSIDITGIFHCAGVLGKNKIEDVPDHEEKAVITPKILGTYYLDAAFASARLDFFVSMSSISALIGDFGRGSYAASNAWADGFMQERESKRKNGKRFGKSISISWPVWMYGNMHLEGEEANSYSSVLKLQEISTDTALDTLWSALSSEHSSINVFTGKDKDRIDAMLRIDKTYTAPIVENSESQDSPNIELLTKYLKKVLSQGTSMPVSEIDENAHFNKYGIDSIIIQDMNQILDEKFPDISRTLFFEYNTVQELCEYFVANYPEHIQKYFGVKRNVPAQNGNNYITREALTNVVDIPSLEQSEDIAIVGIDGRYPMAEDLDVFWDNLKNGVDAVIEIPKNRWNGDECFDKEKGKKNKVYCKWGAFLNDPEYFDAKFFKLSPREAELIDPQERILLECAYHTIEDAGYSRKSIAGRNIGVFIGVMNSQYQLYGALEQKRGHLYDVRSSFASMANRISYYFNLSGPSIAIDTMCSSALSALHLACESIKRGECEMAMVGSANVIIHPAKYTFLSDQHFGSTDGKCRAFGLGGDGYVPGEGVGAVLLKPLKLAIKDNDNIHGIIKGTAMNHGGYSSSYTVPNPNKQADVIQEALRVSQVDSDWVNYIEAHGTGTELGDPIEIAGLQKAYHKKRDSKCAIGSVKTNIGHLESAAGMAALTKVLLQMKHGMLVPSLWSDQLNIAIQFEKTAFQVQQQLEEWSPATDSGGKRYAGISSFGAGGTNVHVIVEEYVNPANKDRVLENIEYLLVLSAQNKELLREQARRLIKFIDRTNSSAKADQESNKYMQEKFGLESKIRCIFADVLCLQECEVEMDEEIGNIGVGQPEIVLVAKRLKNELNIAFSEDEFSIHHTIRDLAEICRRSNTDIDLVGKSDKTAKVSLEEIAFTLQTGREVFESKLAIICSTMHDARACLNDFISGKLSNDCIITGDYRENPTFKSLMNGDSGKAFIKGILDSKDMRNIAELWMLGIDFSWKTLYSHGIPSKVSLPKVIFEKKPYWIGKELLSEQWVLTDKSMSSTPEAIDGFKMPASTIAQATTTNESETSQNSFSDISAIKMALKEVISEVTYQNINEIDETVPFLDYGVSSVIASEMIATINERLSIDLEIADLFSYTNCEKLSIYIQSRRQASPSTEDSPDELIDIFHSIQDGTLSVSVAENLLREKQTYEQ